METKRILFSGKEAAMQIMTIEEMIKRRKQLGYTYKQIAEKARLPLSTVQKVLGGVTASPRHETLAALTSVLRDTGGISYKKSGRPSGPEDASALCKTDDSADRSASIGDILAMPEETRAELIDGRIYMMGTPTVTHQRLLRELTKTIDSYIAKGPGEVMMAPCAVYLNSDVSIYVQPDILVVCDPDKLEDRGCTGAPDWIIEIASPGSTKVDYGIKLFKYRTAGVREYWIVNPMRRIVNVYRFGPQENAEVCGFEDPIQAGIYPDLTIRIDDLGLPG